MPDTDKPSVIDEITERARAGDREAFTELAERNYGRLLGLAMRICGDEQFAREAVQEAYLAAWRHMDGFRGEAAFDTWIYRITINATYRRMRRRREQPLGEDLEAVQARAETPSAWTGAGHSAPRPDLELERARLRRSIAEILPTLPEKYREAFTLRDLDGLNLREIADVTGLTVPAVKTRIHRARLRMRKALTERWDTPPIGLSIGV